MDKIWSLLYLTVISWWFLTFIMKFSYQKQVTYFLSVLFFTSFLFHAISLNISWLKPEYNSLIGPVYWATLHLALSCFYAFVLEHLSFIPKNKKLNIITKILLLALFIGMTKPLEDYQEPIHLLNLAILISVSIKYKKSFRLTFYPQIIGLCLLVTAIILKISGYDIILLNLAAVYYLKECVNHFNIAATGETNLV